MLHIAHWKKSFICHPGLPPGQCILNYLSLTTTITKSHFDNNSLRNEENHRKNDENIWKNNAVTVTAKRTFVRNESTHIGEKSHYCNQIACSQCDHKVGKHVEKLTERAFTCSQCDKQFWKHAEFPTEKSIYLHIMWQEPWKTCRKAHCKTIYLLKIWQEIWRSSRKVKKV